MWPRLIATDLDGTLVRSDGTVSARTIATLGRARDAGATLVLATGRPPRWLGDVAAAIGHRGIAICANGALTYDLGAERIVAQRLIPATALAAAIRRLAEVLPDAGFAVERSDGLHYEPRYLEVSGPIPDGHPHAGRDELATRPCAKLLCRDPLLDTDTLLTMAEEALGRLVTVTHSNGKRLVEASAPGVSKATTLARLCARLGIDSSQVVAFGDMPNDLPMLAWAGAAYAVAGAHPRVLAAVSRHTAAADDDGVAVVLDELFPPAG